jgi:hypothetical protein
MTQNEIIAIADSVGFVVSKHRVWTSVKKDFTYMGHIVEGDLANLMQFAKLVAQHEREACAEIAENWNSNGMPRTGVANEIRARGQA